MLLLFYRGGRYTETDAKSIVTQILSVVAFCHLQGVVHRDLKPEVPQDRWINACMIFCFKCLCIYVYIWELIQSDI